MAGAVARSHPPAATGRSLAFLVLAGAGGARLAEYDLAASRVLWTQPTDVTTRVEVGGNVLVHGSKGTHAQRRAGRARGGDGRGALAARLSRRPSTSTATPSTATRCSSSPARPPRPASRSGCWRPTTRAPGVLRWQATLPSARVAGPAARGGVVAVPLESQYVLLYDGATGLQLGQVLSTEEAATFVRALPEGLFYGSRGLFLLGRDTARGSRHAPGYLARRSCRPSCGRPTTTISTAPSRTSTRRSIATACSGASPSPTAVRSSATVWPSCTTTGSSSPSTRIGRAPLGLRQPRGRGRPRPTPGARSCSSSATGEIARARSDHRRADLPGAGFRARWCAAPPSTPRGSRRRSPPRRARRPICSASLTAIIADPDQRFPALKLFAIEELGRQPGRDVTAKLLQILRDREDGAAGHPEGGGDAGRAS